MKTFWNFTLRNEALGLGCVLVGAFDESKRRQILALARDEEPLYLLPVGTK
jgi:nitroreductase